jgi:hypothetical protein
VDFRSGPLLRRRSRHSWERNETLQRRVVRCGQRRRLNNLKFVLSEQDGAHLAASADVCKLDRLGRSLRDLITMLDSLRDRGVKFRSITEAIDTETPTGRVMWQRPSTSTALSASGPAPE